MIEQERPFDWLPVAERQPAKIELARVVKLAVQMLSDHKWLIILTMVFTIILPKLILVATHLSYHPTKGDGDPAYDVLWALDKFFDTFGNIVSALIITFGIVEKRENRQPSAVHWLGSLVSLLVLSLLQSVGIVFAALFLIFPGIILLVQWSVVAPVLVREKLPITKTFERSAQLVKGNSWVVFGLWAIVFLIAFFCDIGFSSLAEVLHNLWPEGHVDWAVRSMLEPWTYLTTTLLPIALYYVLLEAKEGVGQENVAEVFD